MNMTGLASGTPAHRRVSARLSPTVRPAGGAATQRQPAAEFIGLGQPQLLTLIETPRYDLTLFKIRFESLTVSHGLLARNTSGRPP
jgi:hypothetical protein